MRILNAAQMREADRRTIDDLGVPGAVLMENAGREVHEAMARAWPDLASMRVVVLCGRGNNGGDGFVVARLLLERGVSVSTFVIGRTELISGDARLKFDALHQRGSEIVEVADARTWDLHRSTVLSADLIVDGLFGTGIKPPVQGLPATVIGDVNTSGRPVVAIDLPSGLSADSSEVVGPAIHATVTVTFAAPKLPLVLPPAEAHAGRLEIADIGIPYGVVAGLGGPSIELLTRDGLKRFVGPRSAESHKGTYGRVLVVAGSRGRTGAAWLAAMGALRSGAGLVTVATPASSQGVVAAMGAEYMTEPLPETAAGTVSREALDHVLGLDADVIVVGPGLGRSPSTTAFVLDLVRRSKVPLVIDADGLNAIAESPGRLSDREAADVIVTPHPGEMARLCATSIADVQARRLDVAREFAVERRVHVALKGHRTIVATPGGKLFINRTGNPGMATGGTGDVLAGVLGAWYGQLKDAGRAASLGVFLHGLAGDLARDTRGEIGMIASDVIDALGHAAVSLGA